MRYFVVQTIYENLHMNFFFNFENAKNPRNAKNAKNAKTLKSF